MRSSIAATLAVAAAVLPAGTVSGGAQPDSRDAARFLATVVRQLAANDYADAWQTLHPVDQALVPFRLYVDCESADPVQGSLLSIRTTNIGRERVPLTSNGPIVPSVVVRFRLLLAGPAVPAGVPVHVRAHAILVAGRWRWMLPPKRIAVDSHGCHLARPPKPPPRARGGGRLPSPTQSEGECADDHAHKAAEYAHDQGEEHAHEPAEGQRANARWFANSRLPSRPRR